MAEEELKIEEAAEAGEPSDDVPSQAEEQSAALQVEELLPKPPARTAPRGIRAFTMCRQEDETGISGTGVTVQGVVLASGWCVVNWLLPLPAGSISIFSSMRDFLETHVESHPINKTIITFEDGEQHFYKPDGSKEIIMPTEDKQGTASE